MVNQIASVSLVKYFGDSPKDQIPNLDVRDIRKKPDLEKIDKNLTAQNDNKEEKLNVIIKKTIQENLVSKHLIKELIKEVERLTLTNKIFKNKIIENETKNFKNKIFEIDYIEINRVFLVGFLLVIAFASYGFLTFIADTGMGNGAHRAADGKRCVTISLEMKFISAAKLGDKLIAKVKIQKKTRTLVFLTCEIINSQGVVAVTSGVWKILKA